MRVSSLGAVLMLAACTQPQPPPDPARTDPAESASPAAPVQPETWDRLQALGTEPFWSVDIATGTLRYTTPEDSQGTFFPAERQVVGERQTFTGALKGQSFVLVIEPGQCSDGMSDTVYPLKAVRTLGEDVQRGCARPK